MTSILNPSPPPQREHEPLPTGREALQLINGGAVPLQAVPSLSFSYFSHWLATMVRAGNRVSAFFALPEALFSPGGKEDHQAHRLVAVLASDTTGKLYVVSTQVSGSYPSLTTHTPQLHLFERQIYEKHGLVPEGHPLAEVRRLTDADIQANSPLLGELPGSPDSPMPASARSSMRRRFSAWL